MEKQTIQKMSIDTKTILDRIVGAQNGEVIRYSELSSLIGRNIQQHRGPLQSARRVALNEHGVVIGVIRGEGIKILDDRETVESCESYRNHIRRTAHRALKTVLSIKDFATLPPETQVLHNTQATLFNFTKHMLHKRTVDKVQGAVQRQQAQLPIGKTLDVFRNGEGQG